MNHCGNLRRRRYAGDVPSEAVLPESSLSLDRDANAYPFFGKRRDGRTTAELRWQVPRWRGNHQLPRKRHTVPEWQRKSPEKRGAGWRGRSCTSLRIHQTGPNAPSG
jgi:hypothetical protein